MRILVTGGAGFIGSHIVDRCVKQGHEVRVLDNLSCTTTSNLKDQLEEGVIEFLRGDIRDLGVVKRSMQDVDVVFHEAAQVNAPLSIEDPVHTDDVNVRGTLNLLVAASEGHVQRFIYGSSCSVYGDSASFPTTEDSPLRPLSPYAASKAAGEAYCTSFYRARGLSTICLRYFNVFGPRQHVDGYASVIPAFIRSILRGRPMTIFGDGSQTRDFVHVSDAVEANMLALTTETGAGDAFNIGSGKSVSITELSEILREVSSVEALSPVHMPPRKGDIKHSLADITKAQKSLGYVPRTDLRSDLKTLFELLRKQSSSLGK